MALQECGRKLATHIRQVVKKREQLKKAGLFNAYIKELASSLAELSGDEKGPIQNDLNHYLTQKLPLVNGEKNGKN